MPTTIKLRNSVTTTSAPSSLVQGEVAINITDKKVWVGNAATTPIQLLGDGGSGSFTSIAFGAGTVSSPSITFTGDTNTGIYSPAADTIAFTEGGVESMRIDSSGNVGIGVSPSTKLDVSGIVTSRGSGNAARFSTVDTDGGGATILMNAAFAGAGTPAIQTQTNHPILFATNNTERMRIDSSGNVGIGTSSISFQTRLAVASASTITDARGILSVNSTNSAAANLGGSISFGGENGQATTPYVFGAISGRYEGSGYSGYLQLSTTNSGGTVTERMRITSAGDVGIGTGSPASKLGIAWSTNTGINLSDGTVTGVIYNTGGNSMGLGTTTVHPMVFYTSNTERMRIDSSGNVAIGTTSASGRLTVASTGTAIDCPLTNGSITLREAGGSSANNTLELHVRPAAGRSGYLSFTENAVADRWSIGIQNGVDALRFMNGSPTGGTERMRITSGGNLLVGKTAEDTTTAGVRFTSGGVGVFTSSADLQIICNRLTNDGTLILFRQDNTDEGSISVSGNTVSYNAFAGSHWSQLSYNSKPDILRGTVMESINELVEWPNEPTSERLCRVKISDTVGSKKVYGVFMCWDEEWTATNDMLVTSLGAFICRINKDVVVQEGDLLESNGDGTARVQADDIMRSSTIGKVTCTEKTHQYADGSYCVPTVLYCG